MTQTSFRLLRFREILGGVLLAVMLLAIMTLAAPRPQSGVVGGGAVGLQISLVGLEAASSEREEAPLKHAQPAQTPIDEPQETPPPENKPAAIAAPQAEETPEAPPAATQEDAPAAKADQLETPPPSAANTPKPAQQVSARPILRPAQRPKPIAPTSPASKKHGEGAQTENTAQSTAGALGRPPKSDGDSAQIADYNAQITAIIQRNQRYPKRAQRRSYEGAGLVSFTVTGAGRITKARLLSSTGHRLLDAEILATLERASPLPPPPKAGLSFRIKMRFELPR